MMIDHIQQIILCKNSDDIEKIDNIGLIPRDRG